MLARIKHLVYEDNVLYTAAIYPLVVWALGHLVWRSLHRGKYLSRWRGRFGYVPPVESEDVIWIHAVSVGEVRTVERLVEFLKDEYPDSQVLITTMTPTGANQVRKMHGDSVLHCYVPYDLPGSVNRFLDRVHPRLAFIIETELWPNILRLCEERAIPTLLINARMSQKSFKGYSLFPRIVKRMIERPAVMAARSKFDAERLLALGANPERVKITGNLKFDARLPDQTDEIAASLRELWGKERPVWIAASTHDGEEKKVLEAFQVVRKNHPASLLVIVPRHPERFGQVEKLCRRAGFEVALHSNGEALPETTDIVVGDTMGELLQMYAAADVAFVGGSLVRHGGHNLVEAMVVGTPIVFGPHFFNFEQSSRTALEYGAAERVRDPGELAVAVSQLLAIPERRRTIAEAAQRVIEESQGSLQAVQTVIRETVGKARSSTQPAPGHRPSAYSEGASPDRASSSSSTN